MASANNSHLKRHQFYPGLIPGPTEFFFWQDSTFLALQRVQTRYASSSGRLLKPPAFTLGSGTFDVTVQENAAVQGDGISADWDDPIVFDTTASTHGSFIGSTSPAAGHEGLP